MKNLLIVACLLVVSTCCFSQLKSKTPCATFTIDWVDGRINGVAPDYVFSRIKTMLPCFSSSEEENSSSKCGGKIEYKDNDVRFFTGRDYIEVGEKFKGKQTIPLLGAKKTSVFKLLGNPKLKDPEWEAFQTSYGCIVLYYKAGVVKKIRFSTKNTDNIQLCE